MPLLASALALRGVVAALLLAPALALRGVAPPARRPSALAAQKEYEVTWSGTDCGTDAEAWIEFDDKHYASMVKDTRRTSLFRDALKDRLAKFPWRTATVVDLGTGPYALFARDAVKFGAKKVYAIEAVAASAQRAREAVRDAKMTDRVEILEGFSTALDLPELVDVLVSEVAGSIASEEGVYATIRDAQRFMKRPRDPDSYVPFSYQTLAAPATDLCHHSGGVEPGAGCLRIQSDDATLRLLGDPQLVEDIRFCGDLPAAGAVPATSARWAVDGARVSENEAAFRAILAKDEAAVVANGFEVDALARDVATTGARRDLVRLSFNMPRIRPNFCETLGDSRVRNM